MIPKTKLCRGQTAILEFFSGIGTGPGQISASEFDQALYEVRKCHCLTVLFDSRGGDVKHSGRMRDALLRAPFQREGINVGQCDSAAMDLFMATSNRRALDGATTHLHMLGNATPAAAAADAANITSQYQRRTWHVGALRGCSELALSEWIRHGTSLSAADLWRYGFINSVIEPTDALPLRIAVDISGHNRPQAGHPFIRRPERPASAQQPTAKIVIRSEPTQKRQPIEFPPMPKSLVGKCFHSAADFLAYRRATGKKVDDSMWQVLRALETEWTHRVG